MHISRYIRVLVILILQFGFSAFAKGRENQISVPDLCQSLKGKEFEVKLLNGHKAKIIKPKLVDDLEGGQWDLIKKIDLNGDSRLELVLQRTKGMQPTLVLFHCKKESYVALLNAWDGGTFRATPKGCSKSKGNDCWRNFSLQSVCNAHSGGTCRNEYEWDSDHYKCVREVVPASECGNDRDCINACEVELR